MRKKSPADTGRIQVGIRTRYQTNIDDHITITRRLILKFTPISDFILNLLSMYQLIFGLANTVIE